MGECMLVALGIFAWVFLRWAKEDMEKQDLLDLAQDRHFELSSARAERAVAAGRGSELRARIEAGEKRAMSSSQPGASSRGS